MKMLASLLIWISLGFGAVAAATAYMPPTSLEDAAFQVVDEDGNVSYLKTTVPTGPLVERDGGMVPMYPKDTELTPEVLAEMRELNADGERTVQRVKVKDFAWDRWTHLWHFVGAVVGLVVGGLGSRFLAKAAARNVDTDKPVEETPEGALKAAIVVLEGVLADLDAQPDDDDRLAIIVDRLGELQQTHLAVFGDAREQLIARMGLGRFAGMMDRFAFAERSINRAWSAAADGRVGPARDMADQLAESRANMLAAEEALAEAERLLA